jgi:hypothetical protein
VIIDAVRRYFGEWTNTKLNRKTTKTCGIRSPFVFSAFRIEIFCGAFDCINSAFHAVTIAAVGRLVGAFKDFISSIINAKSLVFLERLGYFFRFLRRGRYGVAMWNIGIPVAD